MIARRGMMSSLLAAPTILKVTPLFAQSASALETGDIAQLDYPSFDAINPAQLFGNQKPTPEQRKKVEQIIAGTPSMPPPVDVAMSFVERFSQTDPDAISQWPVNAAWNPLVVTFFESTSTPANNDLIAWCAAFANWCITRAGKIGTRSASSQSFLEASASRYFIKTNDPVRGNLVIFTCYDAETGSNLGLGHVAFLTDKPTADSIPTVSGNTSKDGRYSIIAMKPFSAHPQTVYRTVDGSRIKTVMKVNSFLRIL